jgi:two-component system OmpR family sensor kinase
VNRFPDTDLHRTGWRIGIQTAALLMVSLLVTGAVVYATVVQSQNQLLTEILGQAMAQAQVSGDPDHDRDHDTGRPGTGVRTAILTAGGLRVSPDTPPGIPVQSVMEQVRADGLPDRRTVGTPSGRYALLTERRGEDVVQVSYSLFGQHQERERILGALGVAGGVGLALSTILGAWLGRRAVRPMSEALILQRRFVADAGHELRTPLTLLSTRAQLLRRRLTRRVTLGHDAAPAGLDDRILQDADGIVADTRTLNRILEELLLAADTRTPEPGQPVDLASLVAESVAAAEATAQQKAITLTFRADQDPAMVTGTPAALTRAVNALIDNALSHASARVDVRVTQHRHAALVRVSDDGPGIADGALPRMFDRFASDRVPQGDPTERRHYGLGLALVNEIALRHGGGIAAANRPTPEHGAVLTLTLPQLSQRGRPRRPDRGPGDPGAPRTISGPVASHDGGGSPREARGRPVG